MATTKNTIPSEALYKKLVDTNPNRNEGATMPYTSLNGHMFSFLDTNGTLEVRLPEDVRDELIAKYKTTLCEAYGTVLKKEYVLVPEGLFN